MVFFKWSVRLVLIALIGLFLHYFLPSRDVVRIVATEVVRSDIPGTGADGQQTTISRDIRYIKAAWPDGSPRVYRNEDTGWGFPWYFKFDTANLATEADGAASSADDPRWVVVRHYGWRITWWGDGMFPNALSMRPGTGPDEDLFPWGNVILLSGIVLLLAIIRRFILLLIERHVDPVIEDLDHEFDQTRGWWTRQWRRLGRLFREAI